RVCTRRDLRKPALVGFLERRAFGFRRREVGGDLGRLGRGVEVREIPFRKRSELVGRFGGGSSGTAHGGLLLSILRGSPLGSIVLIFTGAARPGSDSVNTLPPDCPVTAQISWNARGER